MNRLARALVERIKTEGPLPFAEYMRVALYDSQDGYYRSGSERTGWRGDFVTSPEIDPAFGALWARAFEGIWIDLDRPETFLVVELGPGEGGFAHALSGAAGGDFARALQLHLVELDPERRKRQEALLADLGRIDWSESIEEVEPFTDGIVFANEVLDNQPVHVLRNRAGGFQELHVGLAGEQLVEVWLDSTDEELNERAFESDRPAGVEIEVSPDAEDLALRCARLAERGGAIFVDYGLESSSGDRARTTLASYSSAGAGDRTIQDPGTVDLTAHVDWTAIGLACSQESGISTAGPAAQRDVLIQLGAREIDEELKAEHQSFLDSGRGADAVRSLSRRQALRALLDPGGLGGLQVFSALRGLPVIPAWLIEKDRPENRS